MIMFLGISWCVQNENEKYKTEYPVRFINSFIVVFLFYLGRNGTCFFFGMKWIFFFNLSSFSTKVERRFERKEKHDLKWANQSAMGILNLFLIDFKVLSTSQSRKNVSSNNRLEGTGCSINRMIWLHVFCRLFSNRWKEKTELFT